MENLEVKIDRARFVKRHKPLNRKTKLKIVFDEDDRREFLTGFHKRKVERKKKAHEELLQKLKEERRRIKQEGKNIYKYLVTSFKPLPEFENCHSENLDFENHSVSVTEISPHDIAWKNNWIGANRVEYEEESNNKAKSCDDDTDVKHNEEEEGGNKIKDTSNVLGKDIKSTKDIKKALQKKATAQIKNSKPFQIKNRIEHQRQKKRSLMLNRIRAEKRKNKHKKSKN